MSHIGFRSLEDEAEVGGRERAFCGNLLEKTLKSITDIEGMLRYSHGDRERILFDILGITSSSQAEYLVSTNAFNEKPEIAGRKWDTFCMAVNTAIGVGSDPMRFVARVHSQCEIHGYVEGPNRAWLADIIEEGLGVGVLRKETQGYGKGWEDVVTLLRSRDDGPVVMDYSVCDRFPSYPDSWLEDHEQDEWYEMDYRDQWEISVADIRHRSDNGWLLEMKPENWKTFRVGEDEKSGFDLVNAIYDELNKRLSKG